MNSNELRDCYQVLELEPEATFADVKRSYRELVKVWHPDRFALDPGLERKGQEKLKRINHAFELLEKYFSKKTGREEIFSEKAKSEVSTREQIFLHGQSLFYGKGVPKDAVGAIVFLRKSAEMGFAPAQFLLGHAYYSGEGLSRNVNEAAFWWIKAAEQLHALAQYSLGFLYSQGYDAGYLAKTVKITVDWQIGGAKIEAYKWLNLAITYGAGRQAGLIKQSPAGLVMNMPKQFASSLAQNLSCPK